MMLYDMRYNYDMMKLKILKLSLQSDYYLYLLIIKVKKLIWITKKVYLELLLTTFCKHLFFEKPFLNINIYPTKWRTCLL
jgi:hypothetical protein